MAKTKIPIESEEKKLMIEAGIAPRLLHIGDYEHQRENVREERAALPGVQQVYLGEAKIVRFPAEKTNWINYVNQRKESGHAVEYEIKRNAEFRAGSLVNVEAMIASGDLVPAAS